MSTTANCECDSSSKQQTATLDESRALQRYLSPEVNIFETKDGYVLEAELPGVTKEGLDISVEDNVMTIVGRRAVSEVKAHVLYRESTNADYRRAFELDPAIDASKIEANLAQGVLTVNLPKSEKVKPRKVAVND